MTFSRLWFTVRRLMVVLATVTYLVATHWLIEEY